VKVTARQEIGCPQGKGSVCKVRTKDPENFDEEVKSLVTAWRD
jgi:hypothetical protein